jgi:hypothetical protein
MRFRFRAVSGPLVLVLWQAVPVSTPQDELGRTRVTFGYAKGRVEDYFVDCSGNRIGSEEYAYDALGVLLDVRPARKVRATAFVGRRSTSMEPNPADYPPGTVLPGSFTRSLTHYGGQLAFEARNFGVGAGLSVGRRDPLESQTVANFYVRAGNVDDIHGRADFNQPDETYREPDNLRFGVARNMGHLRGLSWFAGLNSCYCGEDWQEAAFVNGTIPLTRTLDLIAKGLYGGSATWLFGFSGRVNF